MTALLSGAVRELKRRPGRTALTVLSFAVGVALLTMVSLLSRAGTEAAKTELRFMGLGGYFVEASDTVLDKRALALLRSLPDVTAASPLTILTTTAVLGDESVPVLLCGVDDGAEQAIAVELLSGRLPDAGDVESAALCVTMEESAAAAYGNDMVNGRTLFVSVSGREYPFTVVGTARAKSSLLKTFSATIPPVLLVPYSTLAALSGNDTFDRITLQTTADEATLTARVQAALGEESVTVETLATQKERLFHLLSLVSGVLMLISGGALPAVGASLLLTQLTAVAERVEEIGVKKALGARQLHIGASFLLEGMFVSALGAACGLLVGGGVTSAGLYLAHVPAAPSLTRAAIIFLGSILFGGLCSLYPAAKAARLSPLEAFSKSGK